MAENKITVNQRKMNMKSILFVLMTAILTSCAPKAPQTQVQKGSELGYSLNFFRHLLGQSASDDNVSVSPYSAAVALSMLAEGAAGETKVELDNALNGCVFTGKDLGANDSITITSANSVWIDDDFSVRNTYVSHLSKEYDALATTLNFADPATVKAINNWCSEHTEGMIDGIIKELTPEMVMVLVNALYFNGEWEYPFKAQSTSDMVFHGSKGDNEVPFMNQQTMFNYIEYEGNQLVQLPYKGSRYSMYVLLPSSSMGVKAIEEYLTEGGVREVLSMMKPQKINLRLPKFKLEYETSLVKTLESMGVRSVFSGAADLSGIARGPLAVSDVLQKTVVDVDEAGTEAAAVTAIMVKLTSARVEPVPMMNVNRPFYYMLADPDSGTVLFIGRVMNL